MDESTKTSPCKECKDGDGEVELRAEIVHLRQHLAERDTHIVALEGEYLKFSAKTTDLEDQLSIWREKYDRLYDSHKRVQKLNQVLEEKLLQMVDKMKGDKSQLTKDIATLSVQLAESKHSVSNLQKENERYKNDMNLAIQLLQCKPDNFVSQKLDNLPIDTQARVSQYVMSKTKPAATTQSKNGNNDNETFDSNEYEFNISASLMSKILEDSIQDTVTKHCDTCTCSTTHTKPFSYDDSRYSVSTQTMVSGEVKNNLCLNCNNEIKSAHTNSIRSASPHLATLANDQNVSPVTIGSIYSLPLNTVDKCTEHLEIDNNYGYNAYVNDKVKIKTEPKMVAVNHNVVISDVDDFKHIRKNINMEPKVHHKLCERTRHSVSSNKGSENDTINDDILAKDNAVAVAKETTQKFDVSNVIDSISLRKNSQSSMGALSRTSSVAKSTTSTHKSNTQVGPGPRFCSLRMQAGSKNILLDNAQPDVPPVLYKRQAKCVENSIFKDIGEGLDNFIDLDKMDVHNDVNNDNIVIESTLIDVHVDSNNKDSTTSKSNSINPILLNVSSSPLQPLKTHSFSNSSEKNNNSVLNNGSLKSISRVDTLLNNFVIDDIKVDLDSNSVKIGSKNEVDKVDSQDVKIFNFDLYEQSKIANQYARSLRKIDMSQLHTIENTKISKDLPPGGDISKMPNAKFSGAQKQTQPVVNVYPNLTQTHLKVNDNKKVLTNEQSTSSLSSDDSAALLQKQQLLRVAEWVEQNLELQNNLTDPLSTEDELALGGKATRRNSKLHRLTDTLEIALKMPHPVSKYAKAFTRDEGNWPVHNANIHQRTNQLYTTVPNVHNVAKETMFPADALLSNVTTEIKSDHESKVDSHRCDIENALSEVFKANNDKDITPEELARMEYNVKTFLLSGPQWGAGQSVGQGIGQAVGQTAGGRSRRTSSKTETDV